MENKNVKLEKIIPIIGILVGVATIIFALMISVESSTVSSATFGADFYTEIYAAARKTVGNLDQLISLVANGIRFLLLSLGLFEIVFFANKLVPYVKIKATESNEDVSETIENSEIKEETVEDNQDEIIETTEG